MDQYIIYLFLIHSNKKIIFISLIKSDIHGKKKKKNQKKEDKREE